MRFSELVAEQPRIAEIDINPLLASPERIIALDARVVLHPATVADADLPRLAIRPYPRAYVREAHDDAGAPFVVRPIRPEDEPALAEFHAGLSEATVRARYGADLGLAERTAHERLTRICFVDYDREIALVAEVPVDGRTAVAGVARLSWVHASEEQELTLIVADAWQGRGIGRELLRSAIAVSRAERSRGVAARLSPENAPMRALLEEAGFSFVARDDLLVATLPMS